MLQLATLALIVFYLWRGGATLGVVLMTAGLAVHVALALRLVRASTGGVGGHAEWVRETSTRARLRESPAGLVGLVLILAGLGVAIWLGGEAVG